MFTNATFWFVSFVRLIVMFCRLISVAKTNEAAADDSVKLTMSTNITKKSRWQTANAPQA